MYSLRRSLIEIMAAFPVYRTYCRPEEERETDGKYIREAIQAALGRNPGLANEFGYLQKILLLELDDFLPGEEKGLWLHFIMRFQQFTGPLMAKGFEDTLLYVYNRLLSLNEVGGAPEHFGFTPEEFHAYCRRRQADWPHALSATATHDHKRGEDMRARLHVLSEIPQEWARQISGWSRINRRHKGRLGHRKVPSANDEYFLYQTLLGTWPFGDFDRQEYLARLQEYAVKAVREAKVFTAWIKPDQEYEQTYLHFVEKILADEEFLAGFLPFQRRLAHFGILNALGQTLVKVTAPGVPDLYQGTELWDLSLVDPDNRRPVDFTLRRRHLEALQRQAGADLPALLADLLARPGDGRIKLYLLWRALAARRRLDGLFRDGEYRPVAAAGKHAGHVFAFARHRRGACAVTVVPRLLTGLVAEGEFPLGEAFWEETSLELPENGGRWLEELTGTELPAHDAHRLAAVLRTFPVALLTATA
jgi:(1->4)-alpha-D-glucan 1-alpha-D-glucosylmutase